MNKGSDSHPSVWVHRTYAHAGTHLYFVYTSIFAFVSDKDGWDGYLSPSRVPWLGGGTFHLSDW